MISLLIPTDIHFFNKNIILRKYSANLSSQSAGKTEAMDDNLFFCWQSLEGYNNLVV